MRPKYFHENAFWFVPPMKVLPSITFEYQVETPESAFERSVQRGLAEAGRHLRHGEYGLALDAYRELGALILHTAHPTLPPSVGADQTFVAPLTPELVDAVVAASARALRAMPAETSAVPPPLLGDPSDLPPAIRASLDAFAGVGVHMGSGDREMAVILDKVADAVDASNWSLARELMSVAIEMAGDEKPEVRAMLHHDLAVVEERLGDRTAAVRGAAEARRLFERAAVAEGRFNAARTLSVLHARAGDAAEARRTLEAAREIARTHGLDSVVADRSMMPGAGSDATRGARRTLRRWGAAATPAGPGARVPMPREELTVREVDDVAALPLRLLSLDGDRVTLLGRERKLGLLAADGSRITIELGGDATASLLEFYRKRVDATDLHLLSPWMYTVTQWVAYLPHVYFFVIPMAMGDCYAALGAFERAEETYLGTLPYPYLNKNVEVVRLWTRLAELYLDWGDREYRRARDETARYDRAATMYARVARADGTIDPASPLYKDPKFAGLRARFTALLGGDAAAAAAENPHIVGIVREATMRLDQLDAGLNFLGLTGEYYPPFSFEYLQNTARYFAQQAARLEQAYVSFKSQAESEELNRTQLDQQAELARMTVQLEQRGVAEALAGVRVTEASVRYAETQRQNAVATRSDFARVRWELLELSELEAWSGAAAVDANDEVRQTISGFTYYSAEKKRRSEVIADLAYRRTRISHDLEAKRLQREVESATAYKAVAEAQRAQARARVDIARKRVEIAAAQQRFAEENRDFLDRKEFSAGAWYELARVARRLVRRYLEMATGAAYLMERAYELETGRDLRRIRFDYPFLGTPGHVLAADTLAADIDSFTHDYITTTRGKKAPIKQTFSLADHYPSALRQLKQTGRCMFETTLDQFDRGYPGAWLARIRNVELLLVGITNAATVQGTLRNIGVSTWRDAHGQTRSLVGPADVMPLSQYEHRNDALVFGVDPDELRLFENSGVATRWQLDLPLDANDFDYRQILDVQVVLYFDAFYDADREATVRAALPTTGSGSRAFSMALFHPDELFFLRNQGSAELSFEARMFPHSQDNLKRTAITLRLTRTGSTAARVKLRLKSTHHTAEVTVQTADDGTAGTATAGSPLAALLDQDLIDTWSIRITPEDNPQLVTDGALDLQGLTDLQVFFEYAFDYRTQA